MSFFRRLFTAGKGTLELEVTDQLYRLGDEVDGVVTISAKQDLGPGRLFAALVCIEEIAEWRTDRDGRRIRETKRRELWRREADLGVREVFSSGSVDTKLFTLRLPFEDARETPHADTPDWAHGVVAVLDALKNRERNFIWEVSARYDIPKIALADYQKISVANHNEI